METPFHPQIDLDNVGPEIRAYIYQSLMEFAPFTTESTSVAVIAKDPTKLVSQDAYSEVDPKSLKKYWRIAISLTEEGTTIEEEGVHEDIYVAIRLAKESLVKTLSEIQDQVISNQDRVIQIKSALEGGTETH